VERERRRHLWLCLLYTSKLKPHADAQDLLRTAAATATITKFELVEPSLEEIFIETVGGRSDA